MLVRAADLTNVLLRLVRGRSSLIGLPLGKLTLPLGRTVQIRGNL